MSVLKHLKTLQHVSIFSDHLQGARRFLVKVSEFKVFRFLKIIKVICEDDLKRSKHVGAFLSVLILTF